MTRALIAKELRQHWLALAGVGLLSLAAFSALAAANKVQGLSGSPLEALRWYLMGIVPLAGMVVGHRLVNTEYGARTQLFLEALPLPRWKMPTVKYGLGLAALLGITAVVFGATLLLQWKQQRFLDLNLVRLAGIRALSFAAFIFSVCFLYGFLGRYRVALLIAVFLGFSLLAESSNIQWSKFGPFALIDTTFAYEAETMPWRALRDTWLLTAALTALAFGLALVREGSVASLMAEKMSHREKVFVAAVLISLAWTGALISEKTRRTPFDLQQAVVVTNGPVTVKLSSSAESEVTRPLMQRVASELSQMCEYLGREAAPPVFITQRGDLDPDRYERGELEQSDGVFVQANVLSTNWNTTHFVTWLVREGLIVGTNGRAELESRRWILDGFPLFWSAREVEGQWLTNHPVLALRAVYGTADGLRPDFRSWLRFKERVGDDIAAAVAWSVLEVIEQQAGPNSCRAFLQAALGQAPPKDARVLFNDQRKSGMELLQQCTGLAEGEVLARWEEQLTLVTEAMAPALKTLPRIRGEARFEALSPSSRKVTYRARIEPAPTKGTRYSFLHYELPPMDEEVDDRDVVREQQAYPDTEANELEGTFSVGSRVYYTFALRVPELECQVISGWRREEVR